MAYDQYTDPLDITGWSYEQIVQKSREIGNSQLYVSINGITCRLNIPETINKDTSFIVLGRGAGSFISDTGSIFNDMITEKSNTFVVLPINQGDTNQLVDKYKVCYDFTKSIQEANKVDTPVVIHGYSNSGGNAIAAGCEIASRGQKVIVVTCDPANDSAAKYFENANENLTVICLAEDTNGYSERFDRFNSQLQSKGAKTVLVELHGCGHKDLKSQILTDFNLQEFISKGFNINDLLEKGYSL